jgi:hypothetical protein
MPPSKNSPKSPSKKLDLDQLDPIVIDRDPVTPYVPVVTVPEMNGFKVGEHYWFTYRGNENCYGKLTAIFPGNEKIEPSVSIYEEMVSQRYVSVVLSVLRTAQTDGKVKRRSLRPSAPKNKKKPIRR